MRWTALRYLFLLMSSFDSVDVIPLAKDPPGTGERRSDIGSIRYLERFGYLENVETRQTEGPDNGEHPLVQASRSSDELEAAIKRFQRMADLRETGVFDEETVATMQKPRCGTRDVEKSKPRINITISITRGRKVEEENNARFQKWWKTNITYRLDLHPRGLNEGHVHSELKKAFDLWSAVSPLTFSPLASSIRSNIQLDIAISFFSGQHNDETPFDGPGKTLAHAFPPGFGTGGDIHFDREENWTISSSEGVDLFTVAAHELGHALGLNHSRVPGSLMFPWYQGFNPNFRLHPDDVNAIQSLYGGKRKGDNSDVAPSPCATDFDTVTSIRGELLFFKDKWFWRRDKNWRMAAEPALISRLWTELPPEVTSIDAAYERPDDNCIVFFRGKRFFEFDDVRSLTRHGKALTELGLPKNVSRIDAVFTNGHQTHYVSGKQHWKFRSGGRQGGSLYSNTSSSSSSSTSPNIVTSDFLSLPIRTAFVHPDGYIYVFRNNSYWILSENDRQVRSRAKSTLALWHDCRSSASLHFNISAGLNWLMSQVIVAMAIVWLISYIIRT